MHRLPPYLFDKINTRKAALRRANVDVIDLGMGNPNDPTPEAIVDKLAEAAAIKRNQRYSVSRGVENLRREITRFYERHFSVTLDREQEVIATIGSKEGFSHLCLAVLGPGDLVLTGAPFFPIHVYSPIIAGAEVITIPFTDDPDALLSGIDSTVSRLFPKPKLVILNFPHNPTGTVVDQHFFREIVRLANTHSFYVIHDLAYGLTTFDGFKAPSFLSAPGAKEVGVEFFTMSKAFNMAGWRLGFAAGNREMIKLLSGIKGYFDYGIFQAVQIASIIGLRECDADIEAQARIYQGRRDVLCEGLRQAGFTLLVPKAGMFVWARIPERYRSMGSVPFALDCLEKAHVALSPGAGFGPEGEEYVRIALTENEERLKQAVRQLHAVFP